MMISCLKLFLIFFALNEIEASHHVNKKLQVSLMESHNNVASSSSSKQPYRTAFHFQPPKNWMNDPNGPMIYKGIYHLFYQYNPKGAVWGNIVWAHSTSKDLVNWAPQKPAIYPSQPSDINGCWSGSATILPTGKPAIIFTGIDKNHHQIQNLAFPKNASDPYLLDWVKSHHNPLMQPTRENQINATSFRDPTTAWLGPDGKWRVVIGSKVNDIGMAILYTSSDFVNWVKAQNPLHSAPGTGMWECPDFFPVSVDLVTAVDMPVSGESVKFVLKKSLDDTKHDYYTIGDYDQVKDVYTPEPGSVDNGSGLRYDYGKFYASKTFFDSAKNRRVLWGWVNESSSDDQNILRGWSGIQAIPRNVYLDKSKKQLVQWPIKEIEELRRKPIHLQNKVLKQGSVLQVSGITAAQADVEISFKVTKSDLSKAEEMDASWTDPQMLCSKKSGWANGSLGPFGLLVLASKHIEEYTSIFFRIFKSQNNKFVVLMCSDQSRSSLHSDYDKTTYGAFVDVNPIYGLSLRSLIDHSVVESFGGEGKSCITARVYPTLAINEAAHLYAFNNGTQSVTISKLTAWSMNKAKIN